MKTATKKTPTDAIGTVTFLTKTIRRKLYGVVAVNASIGGSDLGDGLVAVRAGKEKHVNELEHVVRWLSERGLSLEEAEEFVTDGLLAGPTGAQDALKTFADWLHIVGVRLFSEGGGKNVSLHKLSAKCDELADKLRALAKRIDKVKE